MAGPRVSAMSRTPQRHWRTHGNNYPLPTGAEALQQPLSTFPSWFLRVTCDPPRHTRRLSDKILIAFHQACDQADFEVAERLLKVVETVLAVPRPIDRERREQEALVAAHERLWQLRHPDPGKEGMTLRPNYGRPHDDGLPTARTARRTRARAGDLQLVPPPGRRRPAGDREVWPR